jgi:hypothetical protein
MSDTRTTTRRGGRIALVAVLAVLALAASAVLGWGGAMTTATYGQPSPDSDDPQAGGLLVAAVTCLAVPPLLAWPLLGWRAALVTLGVEAAVVGLVLGLLPG